MRDRELAPALLLALVCGCGDGIGRPILLGAPGSGGLGGGAGQGGAPASAEFGGSAGALGGAGAAQTAGSGGDGGFVTGGGSPAGSAGQGAFAGEPPDGPSGMGGRFDMDAGPPWGAEAGGRDGPGRDSDEDPATAVPPGPPCESVREWDRGAAEAEQELLRFLNSTRETGLRCEAQPEGPRPPLRMTPELRCAARLHSRDMVERGFFAHESPDGVWPEERMRAAGATFVVAGETIAGDLELPQPENPFQVGAELIAAGGSDCNNLADPRFDAVGIGLFQGVWTLDFTGP